MQACTAERWASPQVCTGAKNEDFARTAARKVRCAASEAGLTAGHTLYKCVATDKHHIPLSMHRSTLCMCMSMDSDKQGFPG